MVLRQVPDRPACLGIAGIASKYERATVRLANRREQRLHEGGFSSAVRPQQAEDNSPGNPQGNAVDGADFASGPSRSVDLCEILGFDGVLRVYWHGGYSLGYAGRPEGCSQRF